MAAPPPVVDVSEARPVEEPLARLQRQLEGLTGALDEFRASVARAASAASSGDAVMCVSAMSPARGAAEAEEEERAEAEVRRRRKMGLPSLFSPPQTQSEAAALLAAVARVKGGGGRGGVRRSSSADSVGAAAAAAAWAVPRAASAAAGRVAGGGRGGRRRHGSAGASSASMPELEGTGALDEDELEESTLDMLAGGSDNRVELNVGGQVFATSRATLRRCKDSMLTALVSGNFGDVAGGGGSGGGGGHAEDGADGAAAAPAAATAVFIDRDPTYFRFILNYLRDGALDTDGNSLQENLGILREARFYHVKPLVRRMNDVIRRARMLKKAELTEEKVYKITADVRVDQLDETFQHMNMAQGYDFEGWVPARDVKVRAATGRGSRAEPAVTILWSKKLSRGELTLLDRLQGVNM